MKVLGVIAILLAAPTPVWAGELVGRASIIDGDTLEIHGERVRLHGIDAPESRQVCEDGAGADYRCGQRAALALADQVGAATITCAGDDIDRYGRLIAVCLLGGEDLNAWLVSEGLAVAYSRYSHDYELQQASAQAAKRGLWAGAFQMPWDWRKAH